MLICIFTGFASGLPLYVLIQLVPAWLRSEGVSLTDIGLFALIGFPYTWKFLWSPLMDRYRFPLLGLRRGWMLATQVLLAAGIAAFGLLQPQGNLLAISVLAAGVAFFSASQDIVLDAYRRELLPDTELGLGNAIHVNAYRIARLVGTDPCRHVALALGVPRRCRLHAAGHRHDAAGGGTGTRRAAATHAARCGGGAIP
jgi:PAT family beta-lactamase induction signal transducer AmpG